MVDLKRLVVFAILMENGEGITGKSPDYIAEKYESALSVKYPEQMLHPSVAWKLREWLKKWEPEART